MNQDLRLLAKAFAASLVFVAVGVLTAVTPFAASRALGLIIVTAAGAAMVGAIGGFLFGLPRVLASSDEIAPAVTASTNTGAGTSTSQPTPPPKRFLTSNSSLEQVSDWLTKIIVGVGLVQIHSVNALLLDFRLTVAGVLGKDAGTTPMIACLILVFSGAAGFLAMYLETRLVLSPVFNTVERLLADLARKAAEQKSTNEQLTTAVSQLVSDPATSPRGLAAAADALKQVAELPQASDSIKAAASKALSTSGRAAEAIEVLGADNAAQIPLLARMLAALYQPAPEGFDQSLNIAAQLNSVPEAKNSPEFWFYQAAAWGQKHHWLLGQNAAEDELQTARDNALDCATRCVTINPEFAIRIYWLMFPDKSPWDGDDDLIDFAQDDGFRTLVAKLI